MPYCTNCGHDNPDGSNFCSRCGAPMVAATARHDPARLGPPATEDTSAVPVTGEPAPADAPRPAADRVPSGDTTKTIPAMVEDRDLEGLTDDDEAAVHALPQGSALLIVQRGANAGSRFLLNTEAATAGRHQSSDIFLDDISVSRRHARFVRTPEGTVVKDSGSLNGTYVNRDLVDEHLLRSGDEVQIGKFRLVYFASPQGVE